MEKSAWYSLGTAVLLAALCVAIWSAAAQAPRGSVTVAFLDVGQGDAVFIESPTGAQVLIDGGPDSGVIRALGEEMPWDDRSIDAVIATHADMDHIGGLIDILPRYRVGTILVPETEGTTAAWRTYLREVREEDAHVVAAQTGERIELGGGAYLEILFPDRPLRAIETNTGCVVSRLVYGKTSFMLPCDAPAAIEKYLVALDGTALKSDVLKAGHHGSKNSSDPLFVGTVDPKWVVFSRGCDNRYGHPSEETIATMERFGIPTLDTCETGTVAFVSDGQTVRLR